MSDAILHYFSENFSFYRNVAAVIGGLWLLRVSFTHIRLNYSNFCAFILPKLGIYKVDVTAYGSWAIVTGASEGIGRGYALELARRGLNVAILSRSKEKLNLVADTIKEKYGREVRIIPVDFTKGQEVYSAIQDEISDLDIAVLVNNVGLSLSMPTFFRDASEQRHRDIIELNCQAMVQMTHIVLPKMAKKGKGIIINLSSVASLIPSPLQNIYAATKIFVNYFSSGLQYEYGDTGIIVQCVKPGYVATSLSGIHRSGWTVADPIQYAQDAVGTLGYQQATYGCLSHAIQVYIAQCIIPERWFMKIATFQLLKRRKEMIRRQQMKTD